jgi:hypothetical protein
VARTQAPLVAAALEAGEALRVANDAAASGSGAAADLRAAGAADRDATNQVVAAAVAVLGGKGQDVRQQLSATVRAAVLDPEVADELRAGVLTSHHEAPGFGFGLEAATGEMAPSRAKARGKAAPAKAAPAKAGKTAKKAGKGAGGAAAPADKAAKAAAREAERQAAAAARAEAEEAQAARRARHQETVQQRRLVERLDAKAARLSERADQAEAEATAARVAADAVEAELADARDRLEELEG